MIRMLSAHNVVRVLHQKVALTCIALRCLFLVSTILCAAAPSGFAENTATGSERAGKIRAALVYYIIKFVDFPFSEKGPLRVCATKEDPLMPYLAETLKEKRAHERSLVIQALPMEVTEDDTKECSVILSSPALLPRMLDLQKKSGSRPPLLICAVEKVAWNGCLIQIFEEENKARLAVDLAKIEAAGFKVSSELLDVSVVNKGDSDGR